MSIKAVIFDFDGVIVDSERKKFDDLRNILAKYDLSLKDDDFNFFIGKKTGFFIKEKFRDIADEILQEILIERKLLQFQNIEQNKLIAGLRELLLFIKKKNLKILIVSGSKKDFILQILKFYSIDGYFNKIISGEDFHSSKPDPEGFLMAIKYLNIKNEEIIVIEDSFAGISASEDAGLEVILLETYLSKNYLPKNQISFKDHFALLEYLKKVIP